MKTFWVQTLGCKVNHYESEQIATLLRSRGLIQTRDPAGADLRVVNTCSVTVEAAAKSRQTARRLVRLPLLDLAFAPQPEHGVSSSPRRPRVIVTGCWATSDPSTAAGLPGVDAVLTHHGDVAADLDRLLIAWRDELPVASPPEPFGNEGRMIEAGSAAGDATDARTRTSKAESIGNVNAKLPPRRQISGLPETGKGRGTTTLPLLGGHQSGRQRAVLKVQDGCDAHCTYCIIPKLRPSLWSKPVEEVVEEARRLVGAGHVEIVLTGIFLGAYGQPTALRRRQPGGEREPLGRLVESLCTRVPGLRRLRLSSLEPGDMTGELLAVLRGHGQVVPHFHLPLQSGSDVLLRRMNRQYGREDFLRMVDRVRAAFDRPALTTDVIVGFPGESDEEFYRTLEVVEHARFVHVHAFPFSPRPGTAAARWGDRFVPGRVVNQRVETLGRRAEEHGFAFRREFVGEVVELLVEEGEEKDGVRHGRSERYFDVHFDAAGARAGDFVRVRVERVTPRRTHGTLVGPVGPAGEAA